MNVKKHNQPLLSIVVPTKDRFSYAKYCIKSLLEITSCDLEIVIIDNGESDELEVWIERLLLDNRLVYQRIKGWMPVIENFEIGLNWASGTYICTIGDDDGVNPEIMQVVKWAEEEKIDALIPSLTADYSWPDLRLKYYGSVRAGLLRLNNISKRPFTPNLSEELKKCLKSGGQLFGFMPKVYYGIVRRECIEEIINKTGRFFSRRKPRYVCSRCTNVCR
jgi:glycosyltransferase involved in cell wall biosynthesis